MFFVGVCLSPGDLFIFLLLLTSTYNPSFSPYLHTLKILTTSSPSSAPSSPLPSNILLVTIYATSLYTNIPHTHDISDLAKFLSKRPPASRPASNFLVSLTHFILTHNYFSFNSLHYLQVKSTAMGTTLISSWDPWRRTS